MPPTRPSRPDLDDYHRIGRHHYSGCLSDWVFAVPPFRDTRALDAEYLDGLRRQGVPERDITRAQVMKSVVSTFLEASVAEILAAAPAVVVLRISDRRPNLPARDYTLGEREALIYLACEDGATPAEIGRVLVAEGADDVSEDEIREFLDGLVASRLVYRERDRYLALALPPRPREP